MHHAVDPQPRNHFNFHSVWRRYFNWSLRNIHYVQHEWILCWLSIICGMLSIHDEIMCPNCMHTKLLCNVKLLIQLACPDWSVCTFTYIHNPRVLFDNFPHRTFKACPRLVYWNWKEENMFRIIDSPSLPSTFPNRALKAIKEIQN